MLKPENITNNLFHKTSVLYQGVIFLLAVLSYLPGLFFGFVQLDDSYMIEYYKLFNDLNPGLNDFTNAFVNKYLGGQYYRPITNLTFLFDILIGAGNPFYFHLTNLLLHSLVCILIYRFFMTLDVKREISFILSAFFAVHPINTNAVNWIVGRCDILAAVFSLLSFISFLNYIKSKRIISLLSYIIFALFAVLSKEVAVMLPFAASLYLILNKNWKKNIPATVIAFIPLCCYIIIRFLMAGKVNPEKIYLAGALQNLPMPFELISKLIFPFGLKVLPDYNLYLTISGIVLFIMILLLPLVYKKISRGKYFFGLAWFILFLIPGLPISTMSVDGFQYWDCRVYLPSIGFILILGAILNDSNVKSIFNISLSVLLLFIVLTLIQSRKYKSEITFWEAAVKEQPNRALFHERLANMYYQNGRYKESLFTINKVFKMNLKDESLRKKAEELVERIKLKKAGTK
ncbi:MAG: hypothetical protein C4539_02100 [Ignavibacteriales bacterium]|nr:MAG: hypothetical protein C4539_02100 [Ignavibacteriales bacterium]